MSTRSDFFPISVLLHFINLAQATPQGNAAGYSFVRRVIADDHINIGFEHPMQGVLFILRVPPMGWSRNDPGVNSLGDLRFHLRSAPVLGSGKGCLLVFPVIGQWIFARLLG